MKTKVARIDTRYLKLLEEEQKKRGFNSLPKLTENLAIKEIIIETPKRPGRPKQKINWNTLIDL